jgi:protein TonB
VKPIHVVYAVSFGLHIVGAIALNQIKQEKQVEAIAISMTTIEEQKEEEKPKPPDPEPVAEAKPVAHRAVPKAAPAPTPEAPPPAPDFGFVMGGGGGPGGIAVGAAAAAPAPVTPKVTKKVFQAAPQAAPEADCGEADTKPKATSMPHPAYTDDARAAAIEGKVRVELTLSPEGTVTDAKIVEGLGHGLDEAAIAALKEAKFNPATRCGKPVASTFTVAVRFAL